VSGNDQNETAGFQAVGDRQRRDGKNLCHDHGTGGAANGTEMGRGRRGGQIGARMKLRAKKDEREQ